MHMYLYSTTESLTFKIVGLPNTYSIILTINSNHYQGTDGVVRFILPAGTMAKDYVKVCTR